MKKMKPLLALAVGLTLFWGCTPKENDGVVPTQPANLGSYTNPLTIYANGKLDTGWGYFIGPDGGYQTVNVSNSSAIPLIYAAGATYVYPATPGPSTVTGPVTTFIPGGVVNGVATAGEGYLTYTVNAFTALDICPACVPNGNYGVNLEFGASSGYQDIGEHFVDLSSGNFTTVKFYAMASSLSTAVAFSGLGYAMPANPTLTAGWQQFSFNITGPINHVDSFFDIFITGYQGANANGSSAYVNGSQLPFTVFVDDITYQ